MASAPGKLILMGEHAVVYGEPGLVVPLPYLRAYAHFAPAETPCLIAPDLHLTLDLEPVLEPDSSPHPLALTLYRAHAFFVKYHGASKFLPCLRYHIHSDIPVKRGMGSGTAISCAVFKAFADHYGVSVSAETLESFAQQMDQVYHGRPSGIDAAVIAHEKALVFQRNAEEVTCRDLRLPNLYLVIADTGPALPTTEVVAKVAQNYAKHEHVPMLIKQIGVAVERACEAIANNDLQTLGTLLFENHKLLQKLNVSTSLLDQLVDIAREQGAYGAKLSGAGCGGVCFALLKDKASALQLARYWEPLCESIFMGPPVPTTH